MKFISAGVLGALFMTLAQTETIVNAIENCATYGQDGNCEKCWDRYVLKDGACVAVSDLCATWDETTGDCLTCYGGYKVENGACVLENENIVISPGPEGSSDCPWRTVKIDGQCKAVSDLCNTWNQTTGKCETCYGGYKLEDGACVVEGGSSETPPGPTPTPSDCPWRTVKIDGECKAVSDLCNTWDSTTGKCLTCYGGYKLEDGACVIDNDSGSGSGPTPPPSGGCPFRTVKINGECKAVSDLCNTWDTTTAECLTCYGGFKLEGGECKIGDDAGSNSNPTPANGCPFRTVEINGECISVSDQCKTWDEVTGKCTSCYDGYNLQEGACVL